MRGNIVRRFLFIANLAYYQPLHVGQLAGDLDVERAVRHKGIFIVHLLGANLSKLV